MRRHIIITGILAAAAIIAMAAAAPSAQREKARYYYLEGSVRQAAGDLPEAYEYFKKAWLTDPAYEEAAMAYGMMRLSVQTDTLQSRRELAESMKLMTPYVDAYPLDEFEMHSYAYVAGRLDSVAEALRVYERFDSLRPGNRDVLLQLADAYMAAHNPGKALATLGRFEKSEGKSPQLSLRKMGYMLASGDTVSALGEADALIESNPKDPLYRLIKGNLYEVVGVNDSVLSAYKAAEALNPEYGSVKVALANYYKNAGDSAAYDRKLYEALVSEDFGVEEKLGLLGDYLQTLMDASGDTSRGDHLFEVLMTQFPHEVGVLDLASRYSAAKGDFKEAAQQIDYALDQDPANEGYWQRLMRYRAADGDYAGAMATYRRASEHLPKSQPLKYLYATVASMAKDYPEAIAMATSLIKDVDPELPADSTAAGNPAAGRIGYDDSLKLAQYYTMLGDTHYAEGDLEKTYAAYDNSLLFNGQNPMTLNNYAYFLSEHGGDLDKAIDMARRAVDMDPENETFLDTLAWVLFKRKEYGEALQWQRKALEAASTEGAPDSAEFYSHLGDILFMNHLPEEALYNWKEALKLDPGNPLLKKKVKHKTFFYE